MKSINNFIRRFKNAQYENRFLLLDYDGTLAPVNVPRDKATPYSGVPEILNNIISKKIAKVIIVTGREAKNAIDLLNLKHPVEAFGSHGFERLKLNGETNKLKLSVHTAETLKKAYAWSLDKGYDQVFLKESCLAFKWHGKDINYINDHKPIIVKEYNKIISTDSNLIVKECEGGIEIRHKSFHKGLAVREIISENPNAVIAFLGDDETDEDAFNELNIISKDISIKLGDDSEKDRFLGILVKSEFKSTKANAWIKPPLELLNFFESLS